MIINSGVNLVNIALNWVLIYGNLGAPALGVAGAAIATSVSRVLGAAILLLLLGMRKLKLTLDGSETLLLIFRSCAES